MPRTAPEGIAVGAQATREPVVAGAQREAICHVRADDRLGPGRASVIEPACQQLCVAEAAAVGELEAVDGGEVFSAGAVEALDLDRIGAACADLNHQQPAVLGQRQLGRRDAGAEQHAVRRRSAIGIELGAGVSDPVMAAIALKNVGVPATTAAEVIVTLPTIESRAEQQRVQVVRCPAAEQSLVRGGGIHRHAAGQVGLQPCRELHRPGATFVNPGDPADKAVFEQQMMVGVEVQ